MKLKEFFLRKSTLILLGLVIAVSVVLYYLNSFNVLLPTSSSIQSPTQNNRDVRIYDDTRADSTLLKTEDIKAE